MRSEVPSLIIIWEFRVRGEGWNGNEVCHSFNKYDLIVYSEPSGRAAAMPLRAYYSLHQQLETGESLLPRDTDNTWRHLWLSLGKRRW